MKPTRLHPSPHKNLTRPKKTIWQRVGAVFWTLAFILLLACVAAICTGIFLYFKQQSTSVAPAPGQKAQLFGDQESPKIRPHGVVVATESEKLYSAQEVGTLIRQTQPNYKGLQTNVTMQLFKYRIQDANGATEDIYARVFIPESGKNLPVLSFAPGTTGIDDSCAASLEDPAKRNWANYVSHMLAYASNGYVPVITDYEGMRDPKRVHHYMVGDLEGRAVLDAAQSLTQLGLTKDRIDIEKVLVAGYSQGGHAALWADQLANTYAPSLKLRGVVGFGPVTDVRQTLTDTTRGANILWFGPYLLRSYQDWYGTEYNLASILKSPYHENLAADVAKNCIDTNIAYWGNRDINKVYTPAFIEAMKSGSLQAFNPTFDQQLQSNLAGAVKTSRPKLINHGKLDNVVLPAQSDSAVKRMCGLGESVVYKIYPDATHYNTMAKSFDDTLVWMKAVLSGSTPTSTCK